MKKSNYKKSLLIILPFIAITALLAWFVMAAVSNNFGIKVITPAKGTNWSGTIAGAAANSSQVLFNVTFLNATDIWDPINATFLLNYTGNIWAILGNSSHCVNGTGLGGGSFCAGNLNISVWQNGSPIKDGIYGVNVTISNHSGLANTPSVNISNTTTQITIDNTAPNQTHFQTLTSGNNHSTISLGGNLTLNVSAYDITTGISNVVFRLVNESGSPTAAGNISAIATQEGTSTYWSASINTAHLVNGVYNVTAMVNDTAGNFNSTVNTSSSTPLLKKIAIDNTAPTISHSCTPNPVEQGETITCTCSGTDWPAGVNSTTFTANPSTTNSGPGQTTTCTVTDRARNEATNTFTYTVNGGGGSSGGSTGGAGGSAGGSGGSGGSSNGTTGAGSSTGNQGGSTGSGGSGQGTQPGAGAGGLSIGIIIAIIIAAIVVVVIIVMLKKKGSSQ